MGNGIHGRDRMTDKLYDGLTYDETILRLLFLIAKQKFGNYDGNQRSYMHRLERELFK